MIDKISLQRIELMHPKLVGELKQIYTEICEALKGRAICRLAYTLRTNAEQDALYAIGRSKPGKVVTNAKGGQSYHNYGLAVDIVLLKDTNGDGTFETASWETNVDFDGDGVADWVEVVRIFKEFGWEWGGDWKFSDKPHFQKTLGKSIRELQVMAKDEKGYPKF
jgi:peptidoglycan L-alanyl-D-glutamate endopeptidase CwlK